MEWLEIVKDIPYGKAGMIVGFVLALLVVVLWFQDRIHRRWMAYLSGRDHDKTRD